jgi:hypothetical protein
MKAQFVVRTNLSQVLAMGAAGPEVILAVSFKPTHRRQAGNNLFVMLSPKADARAQPST